MEGYLSGLNPAQEAAVLSEGAHLLVHAGAGSGKTRVVISRILHHILAQDIAPWRILAVTFTNRATREMRERLAQQLPGGQAEQVLIRTFHSFGAWFLRRYAEEASLARNFNIYDEEDAASLLKQTWPELGKRSKLLYHWISKAKDYGLSPSDREELAEFCYDPDFPQAFQRYQEALRRSGNVDFADLLGLPVKLLEGHEKIRREMQQRFLRVLVDEYQDSNPLQNRLLRLLIAGSGQGAGSSLQQELCIVGDDDQSIYSFRGAEISHILDFEEHFAPSRIIKLEQNYRSTQSILDLANHVISQNRQRLGKQLFTEKQGGRQPEFHHFDSYEDEAVFCAQTLKNEPGLRSAILYRTNAQSRIFEQVLREWGIKYRLIGNLSFYRREEIKDITAYLKSLANPADIIAFERIINKPKRGLGPRVLEELRKCYQAQREADYLGAIDSVLEQGYLAKRSLKLLEGFRRLFRALQGVLAQELPLVELVQEVLELSGLYEHYRERDHLEASERCAHISELLNEASHFGSGETALSAFLERIDLENEELEAEDKEEDAGDMLSLITMHNTKGLEYERVFITGLELGLFPKYENIDDPKSLEEERRLFYVAITRAEKELYLSAAKYRLLYGSPQRHELSPLLTDVDASFFEDCSSSGARAGEGRPAQARGYQQAGENSPFKSIPSKYLPQMKAAEPQDDPFSIGARVEHIDYGLGYVVKRKRSGDITTLMIKLDDGRLIRLQLEFQGSKLDYLGHSD